MSFSLCIEEEIININMNNEEVIKLGITVLINEEQKGKIYKVINMDDTKFLLDDNKWILKSNCTVVDLMKY
jgi:hypothetical protein